MADNDSQQPDLHMNPSELYHEQVFTDRKVGSIQRLTPVTGAGETDASRETRYLGQTQIMTQMGALPVNFEIEADSLDSAAHQFGELAAGAVEETLSRLREMQRESASSIVTPGQGGMGGAQGGGNISMP